MTMLYDKYKIYCQDNGMRPYGKQTFNKELETNLSDIVRGRDTTGNKRVWKHGIAEADDDEPAVEPFRAVAIIFRYAVAGKQFHHGAGAPFHRL